MSSVRVSVCLRKQARKNQTFSKIAPSFWPFCEAAVLSWAFEVMLEKISWQIFPKKHFLSPAGRQWRPNVRFEHFGTLRPLRVNFWYLGGPGPRTEDKLAQHPPPPRRKFVARGWASHPHSNKVTTTAESPEKMATSSFSASALAWDVPGTHLAPCVPWVLGPPGRPQGPLQKGAPWFLR